MYQSAFTILLEDGEEGTAETGMHLMGEYATFLAENVGPDVSEQADQIFKGLAEQVSPQFSRKPSLPARCKCKVSRHSAGAAWDACELPYFLLLFLLFPQPLSFSSPHASSLRPPIS